MQPQESRSAAHAVITLSISKSPFPAQRFLYIRQLQFLCRFSVSFWRFFARLSVWFGYYQPMTATANKLTNASQRKICSDKWNSSEAVDMSLICFADGTNAYSDSAECSRFYRKIISKYRLHAARISSNVYVSTIPNPVQLDRHR